MSEDEFGAWYLQIRNENDIDSNDEWQISLGAFDAIQEIQDEFHDKEYRNWLFCIFFAVFKLRKSIF